MKKNLPFFIIALVALLATVDAAYVTSGTDVGGGSSITSSIDTATTPAYDERTLFTFALTGSAKQRFLASDNNEASSASVHGSDIHVDSDTDSLVVHVVYDDICKYTTHMNTSLFVIC